MILAGCSIGEAAERLGLSKGRMEWLSQSYCLVRARRGMRRLGLALDPQRFRILGDLATAARITPAELAGRIVVFLLDQGTERVCHQLGRAALPKRPYRRRA